MIPSQQSALGGSTGQAVLLSGAVLEKNMLGKQTRARRALCYPISADAASGRGCRIPGITV